MDFTNRQILEGQTVFRELTFQGIQFEITDHNKLRINSKTTKEQFEKIRLWRNFIIKEISPKCSNCFLHLELIDDGKIWFCRLGCESKTRI